MSGPFDAAAIGTEAHDRGEDALATVIGQLAGYASVCWENPGGAGVFDSDRAKDAVDSVLAWLHAGGHVPNAGFGTAEAVAAELRHDGAVSDYQLVSAIAGKIGHQLGMATTRQILDELRARIEIDYFAGGGGLDYTTVSGRPEGIAAPVPPVLPSFFGDVHIHAQGDDLDQAVAASLERQARERDERR